jgi:hypothetical protein
MLAERAHGAGMVNSELEMLREEDEAKLGERRPFESARQATYEDSAPQSVDWDEYEQQSEGV